MRCFFVHEPDTVGISGWYMESAYVRRSAYGPLQFKKYKPNGVLKQIASEKESPPDYFLIWEGGVSNPYCTSDLQKVKVPKVMWFSDSYPVKGYMDYFPFETFWANNTRPDIILMAQRGKIKDMEKATNIPTYWLPFAADLAYHKEVGEPDCDISYVGTINPDPEHADHLKADYLSKIGQRYEVKATISHDSFKGVKNIDWKIGRPVLKSYSKEICRGRIGFNCNIAGDLTMRSFEIPLMNRPLLSNGGDNWDLIFENEKDIVIYDENTLMDRMSFLKDEGIRKEIAKNGFNTIIKRHTYSARIKQIELLIDNKITEYERELYG